MYCICKSIKYIVKNIKFWHSVPTYIFQIMFVNSIMLFFIRFVVPGGWKRKPKRKFCIKKIFDYVLSCENCIFVRVRYFVRAQNHIPTYLHTKITHYIHTLTHSKTLPNTHAYEIHTTTQYTHINQVKIKIS